MRWGWNDARESSVDNVSNLIGDSHITLHLYPCPIWKWRPCTCYLECFTRLDVTLQNLFISTGFRFQCQNPDPLKQDTGNLFVSTACKRLQKARSRHCFLLLPICLNTHGSRSSVCNWDNVFNVILCTWPKRTSKYMLPHGRCNLTWNAFLHWTGWKRRTFTQQFLSAVKMIWKLLKWRESCTFCNSLTVRHISGGILFEFSEIWWAFFFCMSMEVWRFGRLT